jgi:hypothetical protein
MRIYLLFFLSFLIFLAFAQDPLVCHVSDKGGRYREHNFDALSLDLNVNFNPQNGEVIGEEILTFKVTQADIDSIFLDAPFINIETVFFTKTKLPLRFASNEKGVAIYFSSPLTWRDTFSIKIKYSAQPRKGLYFIGWQDQKNLSRKQIWTQGQGIDNRYWFPAYDDVNDKVITSTTITFDAGYTVISNGELKSKKLNSDSTITWKYQMTKPHSPYLVMLAIDKYGYKDYVSKSGVVSRQYFYKDRPQDVAATYRYSTEMMDWMEKELQVPYPWTTYSNTPVQDFMYGAMENTTATIYGDFYLLDDRANIDRPYVSTNAHELTHQWFGDMITEWSATHHWLHESFATYYAKQFSATVYGQEQYEMSKYNEMKSAINADNQNRYPVAHSKAGSARHYPKGSFVIDMLRYTVGDTLFNYCITQYLKKHAYGMVDSHDFFKTFIENAGINLDWFFDQWIYRSGYPKLNVKQWENGGKAYIVFTQTQPTDSLLGYFKFPVDIEFYYTDNSVDKKRFFIQNDNDTIAFELPKNKTLFTAIPDAGLHFIREITEENSYDQWLFRLKNAHHFIDKYQSLIALRTIDLDKKAKDLQQVFYTSSSIYLKAEILSQLSKDESHATSTLFKKALIDADFMVRRAAIEKYPEGDLSITKFASKLLTDTSYTNIELALDKLCKLNPDKRKTYLALTDKLDGTAKNIRVKWLKHSIEAGDLSYQKELVDYTSASYEFRTRGNAMRVIAELDFCNEYLVKNLVDAFANPNRRLAGQAQTLITELTKTESYKPFFEKAVADFKGLDWQKEYVAKLKY